MRTHRILRMVIITTTTRNIEIGFRHRTRELGTLFFMVLSIFNESPPGIYIP